MIAAPSLERLDRLVGMWSTETPFGAVESQAGPWNSTMLEDQVTQPN